MLLRTCLALFVATGAWAQQTRPASGPSPKRDAPLTRSSFSAKGLYHEDDLTNFFVGNFANLPYDRGSWAFSVLFEQYMESYGRNCDAHLPAKTKVAITTQVCDDPPLPPDRSGVQYVRNGCSSPRTIILGYADPAVYAAKTRLDIEQEANHLKDLNNAMGAAKDSFQLTGAMDALIRRNACDGAGLLRFQENVVLFSRGKPPLLLPGESAAVTPGAQPLGVLADSDYNRLVEDLVADQSRTWAFNHFVPGSTSHVIVSHDPTGRPARIIAKYSFSSAGRSDRTQGSVTVSFSDGMPECIYYSDAPTACQTPSRRVIAKYSSGGYLDASASPGDSSPGAGAPVQPPPNRGASAQPPPATTRRSVNPAAPTAAPATAPAPAAQALAAERQRRAQKAADCRQQAVKDHPEGGVAMTQKYTSCLQAK